jgi:hypothetical protein
MFKSRRYLHALAGAALVAAGTAAQAITLVGLTSSNEIARIDSANVGAATRVAITGLTAGDRFIDIDLRPSTNTIYGITESNRLYTINEFTGAATLVATLSSPVFTAGNAYGIDFNPMADYSGAASLRVVSSAGNNFAVNASTGAVTVATSIAAGYTAVSYTNSAPFSTGPASTSLYYINSTSDTLSVATTGFNNPTINLVGSLGIDILRANGFEVAPDGTAYAAFNLDSGNALTSGLYTVNLATGAATAVGTFNGTLSGLTISAVPEPGTYAMLLAGLGVVGFMIRRRQA